MFVSQYKRYYSEIQYVVTNITHFNSNIMHIISKIYFNYIISVSILKRRLHLYTLSPFLSASTVSVYALVDRVVK